MRIRNYKLSADQKTRLQKGLGAALSIPFIDSIEDFIWEGIFCYVKQVDLVDPFDNIRTKLLFDVVDKKKRIGWSAKGLQCRISPGCEFELVIQRADIFKKQNDLGYSGLSKESDPNLLGEALLKHWQNKVNKDAKIQNVNDQRVYQSEDLYWKWTDSTSKVGLQGIRKVDDFVVYRWYPNQTQFFERFKLPKDAYTFELTPKRFGMDQIIEILASNIKL
jgi:hypothetical protein